MRFVTLLGGTMVCPIAWMRLPVHDEDAYRAGLERQANRAYASLSAFSRAAWDDFHLREQFAEQALNPGMADDAYGGPGLPD